MSGSVHRDAKIKEVLESSIRTEHTIEPSFGHVSYFQYTLRNPYSEVCVCVRERERESVCVCVYLYIYI